MATILDQGSTCDGYDVLLLLSNGLPYTLHFPLQPAQGALEAAIVDLEDRIVVTYIIYGEADA